MLAPPEKSELSPPAGEAEALLECVAQSPCLGIDGSSGFVGVLKQCKRNKNLQRSGWESRKRFLPLQTVAKEEVEVFACEILEASESPLRIHLTLQTFFQGSRIVSSVVCQWLFSRFIPSAKKERRRSTGLSSWGASKMNPSRICRDACMIPCQSAASRPEASWSLPRLSSLKAIWRALSVSATLAAKTPLKGGSTGGALLCGFSDFASVGSFVLSHSPLVLALLGVPSPGEGLLRASEAFLSAANTRASCAWH